ncbi:hypothetical protein [Lysobacter enzymogenes]|uniref:hypothetical protein n=1 Tax=Lysobacter enzymogenes TaxID=69 RepID=UPI0019CFE9A3|nr:hypothetical protein [Lysobacter enzymogenes]
MNLDIFISPVSVDAGSIGSYQTAAGLTRPSDSECVGLEVERNQAGICENFLDLTSIVACLLPACWQLER